MCCGIWMAGRGRKGPHTAGPVSREKLHRAGAVRRGAGDGTLNYPFLLTMEPLIGALAAGNCCVLKPSEDAPRTSAVIASLLEEIYPKSLTVVEGDRKISAALLEQRFDYICFTGSVSVGKLVMEQAAKHLTPVTLELGGKSPCIVDETADLSRRPDELFSANFLNSGQTWAPDYAGTAPVQEKFMQELCRQTKRQLGREPLANPHYPRMVNERTMIG